MALLLEHEDVCGLVEADWRERLIRSVAEPVIDDRSYPRFPDRDTQRFSVGSADVDTMGEALNFYNYVKGHMDEARLRPPAGRYLDFGCGWGRITRCFLRDFKRGEITGVDVDHGMVSLCQATNVPGGFLAIPNACRLPFESDGFSLITAYSVFTHLPPSTFRAWLAELLRVTKPGGLIAFTVEPERFLDFVAGIDLANPESGWHHALGSQLGSLASRKAELHRDGCTYLPTGGGGHLSPDVYGDVVVTRQFVERCLAGQASIITLLDDPNEFWQAVVVVRKHRWSFKTLSLRNGR